jgi:DNA-directed RNA polymerase specialized sigma24 family protein
MSVDGQASDGDLLRATRGGDGAAFATFYRRYLPRVVAFLLRETGDREASADLAAEVFAAVLVSARRYRSRDEGSAWPWVRGIALNKLRESRRHGRVEDRARRGSPSSPSRLMMPIWRA